MTIETRAARLEPFDLRSISGGPMAPIVATNGLVFQYTPTVSESVTVEYEAFSAPHTNEKFHVFKGRDNRKIDIGNVVFTADTRENLQYMVAAIHFFRTYTHMDYGSGKTARPPSPMWFYAFGALGFERVPVLLSGYSLSFDGVAHDLVDASDVTATSSEATGTQRDLPTAADIFGGSGSPVDTSILEGLTTGQSSVPDIDSGSSSGLDIVVPMKMEISGIQLIVQHSPRYWKNQFSLQDFKAGKVMESREGAAVQNSIAKPPTVTQSGAIPDGGLSVINEPGGIPIDQNNTRPGSGSLTTSPWSSRSRNHTDPNGGDGPF